MAPSLMFPASKKRLGAHFKLRFKRFVGSLARQRRFGARRVILCYHSVHPEAKYRDATPEQFRAQIEYLLSECEVVSLRCLLRTRDEDPGRLSRPQVALTFDDGYMDNATYVRSILRDYGLTATFLVSTGLIEGDPSALEHMGELRGFALQRADIMNWRDLDALASDGHEIGAHGHGHRNLARLPLGEQTAEIMTSRELIAQHRGIPPTVFAYPFGKPGVHFSEATKAIVAECGFQVGLAVHFRGLETHPDLLALPRFTIFRDTPEELGDKVNGGWDIIGSWQTRVPGILKRAVSPEDYTKE